jgi:hypothetical protein
MDKSDYEQLNDFGSILDNLRSPVPDRPLRLFACAAARRIWSWIDEPLYREIVQYAEYFANGPGRDAVWIGDGNWASRSLSATPRVLTGDDAVDRLLKATEEHRKNQPELISAIRYDYATPWMAAEATLHFRYDYAFYGPNNALTVEAVGMPYWVDGSQANFDRVVQMFEYGEPDITSRLLPLRSVYCHMLKELLAAQSMA